MAERLGLGSEVRELKLGPTFTNNKSTAFHTVKYDFKPASVDVSKIAMVDVGTNNTMTVTVPHLDGAGIPHTVFKGSQRPHHKECVLIIDHVTGEITLEKLSSNIQVKKTRIESKPQSHLNVPATNSGARPITPVETKNNPTDGRNNSRTKVSTGKKREPIVQLHPKTHSPFRASSNYHGKSPSNNPVISNSPAQPTSQSTLASLPMIGFDNDDFSIQPLAPKPPIIPSKPSQNNPIKPPPEFSRIEGDLSVSSSSSSSSDSSDSESDIENILVPPRNGQVNGLTSPSIFKSENMLNDDLQLSESESDSD
ncbi:ell-associated factor Eaf [Leptopilina heterotoma]|uniref:ell-associated factor Eaf n=1 Tax=Leptopilina heterotoma TaxID=63436 RepID=UPI001CA9D205|nr:ell-associated factor Eaf [Leptopilina heterotoma]